MDRFKEKLLNDILWYYTFIVILLKCIIFLGFTVDDTHTAFYFFGALNMAMPRLMYYASFAAAFLSLAFLFRNRARMWYLTGFNAFVSVLLMADLWYFRGFSTLTSLHLLQQATNLTNLSDSIISLVHLIDLVFVFDVVIIFVLVLIKKDLYRQVERQKLAFAVTFTLSICILSYIPVKVNVFGHKDEKAIFSMLDADITSYNLSPLGYHVMNVYSFWKDSIPLKLSDAQKAEITKWYKDKDEVLPDNKFKGAFKGKNLVTIQVESLENFVLNQKVDGQEITPNLNKLLMNSLYFPNIHEQVNQGTTSDAEFMANTSIYPLRQGSTFFSYPYNTYRSLPKLLQDLGYFTLAIHSDKGSYWNWMTAHTSIGFQKGIDSTRFEHDEIIGMGLSDGSYLRQLGPILAEQKQPFYSFIVTLSSHAPYNLPDEYREMPLKDELDKTTLGGYFQSIHYLDKQIGLFLSNLEENGLIKNTVVVIYGDHEGIHKYYPGDIQEIQPAESWWKDNGKRVPLIIYQSEQQGQKVDILGGQIDILPTISYLMGVEESRYSMTAQGRNLLNTVKSFVVLRDGEIITDKSGKLDTEHAVNGLNIADNIIKSNYFKDE